VSFEFTKTIDHTLYPRKALAEARQAYRDYCTLTISPLTNDRAQVSIFVKDAYENDCRQVVLDFLNYMLDRSAQIHLEEEPG
jgi:hypothetical protein